MTLRYSLKTALRGLQANKSRSALTILGIVIGITAIMLVMSLGQGAQNLILGQIQSIGSKTIAVSPGRQPQGITDSLSTFTDSLKAKDLVALEKKENVPHLAKMMPIVFGSETAIFENQSYASTIFGVTDLFAKIYDMYPEQGRIFSDDDVKSYADVAVIGSKIKDELFGNDEALDKKIKIKGRSFRIIGILGQKGQFSFINFDSAIIIPYTTAQQYVFGIKYFNRLVIEADDEANVIATVEDIKTTLRNSHNITDPDKDDFFVETQADAMEMVSTIMGVLTLFLAAVAAISLLVGGVGIMNIMLVSVTERTREIGLRKALGANIVEELGLGILPEEQKINMLAAVTELIGVRLMARVHEALPEGDREAFVKSVEGGSPETLFPWLKERGVDFDQLLLEEIAKAKEDLKKRAQAVK